ncbi:hypothetical protein STRDD13_01229 [Streptococcus sp. DD13]|nr:hypothetical protein STRDD13_01229 [Streptococcus sp. DD13]
MPTFLRGPAFVISLSYGHKNVTISFPSIFSFSGILEST